MAFFNNDVSQCKFKIHEDLHVEVYKDELK